MDEISIVGVDPAKRVFQVHGAAADGRVLIIGAMAVVRWRSLDGRRPGTWLAGLLARKPKMLVAIALANKMARMIWAMLVHEED